MKKANFILICTLLMCISGLLKAQVIYLDESKQDFDKRMKWFKEAKFGMFIHFGLYSQLGGEYKGKPGGGYAEWIQADLDIPSDEYAKLIKTWNPKDLNPDKIVKLAKDAGMKYLVITTKHHEGFCLWDSAYTNFDIASSPMKGHDILKEFADACKKYGLKFGTYYSIIDWHHDSQYRNPNAKNTADHWGQISMKPEKKAEYITYIKNQIKELINKYNTEVIWFDGSWASWWDMESGKDLYQYIRSLKPSIIINNRVAKTDQFKKDFGTPEQEHPESTPDYDWEACYTMNNSWGYKKSDNNWKSPEDIINKLNDINNKGGNLLLNIGPDGNGNVPLPSINTLQEVGKKLKQKP
ncbi:alpha-L-fucosidase [Elizabethkingia ursingii]|uniref:alpha-L-fucosidase n=1 Tax=Elizabethkingia ursingii TaxID=1756150 RepID=UPI002012681E|nr:alpha-L-fucosidase [Elizabethkingia ursingii]MCL1668142.1 alpha-L-fucosidase [Elizabethkingia ursingii]